MMFSQCNTCSMVIYITIQYQGECGHIEGHAYSVLFVHNETCVLGFHVYTIYMSLVHPRKTSFQNTVKPLNNMHADTFGAGPLPLLERLSYTKTN